MLLRPKIVLACLAAILVAADTLVVWQRFEAAAPEPISWPKIALALSLQLGAACRAASYAAYLLRSGPDAIESLKRYRVIGLPILVVALTCVFSLQFLYVAVVCGSQRLPTHRGQEVCPAAVATACPK